MPWRTLRMYRIAASIVVLFAALAFARVGSGEHYTSDDDRTSSSDDGAVEILFLLIRLAIEYPACGVPMLLAFVGYLVWKHYSQGDASTRKAFERAQGLAKTQVSGNQVQAWVAAIQAKDPQFQLLPLLDQVKRLFVQVQEAWFLRDLRPVRHLLSDATSQRLSTQLGLLRRQGVRDAIADVEVNDLQLIGLEQSEAFDTVHVRVQARMRDTDVPAGLPDDQARAKAKATAPQAFVEVWSFVRKPGVATKAVDPSAQGLCPNCGAPFAGGASNRCQHCNAVVSSGNYSWVLAEITQGHEHAHADQATSGVARIRQGDPAFSTEVLEDRAALCFWRWIEALSTNQAGALARVASPAFVEQVTREVERLAMTGQGRAFLECAVGAVHTRRIDVAGDRQRAFVEIRWSARHGVGPQGQAAPKQLPVVPRRDVLVLERAAQAQSNPGNGMATSHCPNCGGPESTSGATRCEWCGQALGTGEKDWVLAEVQGWESFSAQRAASTASPSSSEAVSRPEERERLLYLMAAIAAADGVIDHAERSLLTMCAQRWGVSLENLELALNAGPALFDKLLGPKTPEAEAFLRELVALAKVDGEIDRRERQLLERAAKHLGLEHRLASMLAEK